VVLSGQARPFAKIRPGGMGWRAGAFGSAQQTPVSRYALPIRRNDGNVGCLADRKASPARSPTPALATPLLRPFPARHRFSAPRCIRQLCDQKFGQSSDL